MRVFWLGMAMAMTALLRVDAIAQRDQVVNGAAQPQAAIPKVQAAVGPHGGPLQAMGGVQVEAVLKLGGIEVFAYDSQGRAIDVRGVRGVATLQLVGDSKRYRYDLFPEVEQDQTAESLGASVDLSKIAGRKVEVKFQLVGLAPDQRQPTQFVASASVPRTKAQRVAAAIAKQKVCLVSGQPLGAMGKPVAVTFGAQTIYVCCEGCIDEVQANPKKYLAMLSPPPESAKPKVVKATPADASFVALQKNCPVVDGPLAAMGGPYRTVVDGKVVYLCCPGCASKLFANPNLFLEKLSRQGVDPPVAQ